MNGKPCLWCGKKLRVARGQQGELVPAEGFRPPYKCYGCASREVEWLKLDQEEHGHPLYECLRCKHVQRGERKMKRTPPDADAKLGAYGDGFFCSLSCGFSFAVAAASKGVRR